jgi:hypothetical protein
VQLSFGKEKVPEVLSFVNRNPGAAAIAAALLYKHESGISAEPSKFIRTIILTAFIA